MPARCPGLPKLLCTYTSLWIALGDAGADAACPNPVHEGAGCDRCVAGHVGYPQCRACSVMTDCGGANYATGVDDDGTRTYCVCNCASQYDGANCEVCASGLVGHPDCRACDADIDCNGHATAAVASSSLTSCECTCRNQWSGPTCGVCPPPYGGPDCSSCGDYRTNYPLCSIDECMVPANNATCTDADQECADQGPTAHNWLCKCVAPYTGNPTLRGAAVCTFDECDNPENAATCQDAGQLCDDPDMSLNDTWTCVCSAPAVGSTDQAPADCMLDECTQGTGDATCAPAGQDCHDADTAANATNDWVCRCRAPQAGPDTVAAPASCTLDECNDALLQYLCSSHAQACVDPDQNATATNDWTCVCVAPETGEPAVMAVATCTYDECMNSTHRDACAPAEVQECFDPDITVHGNWGCRCVAPWEGAAAVGGAAVCALDECSTAPGNVTCVGDVLGEQECVDEEFETAGDWVCRCRSPSFGNNSRASPAACQVSECEIPANAAACADHQQSCIDLATNTTGDWVCRCPPGSVGMDTLRAPAACTVDECLSPTASTLCAANNQTCHDPDTALNATDDWTCICSPPSAGAPATMAAADCTYDECTDASNSDVCDAASQACADTNLGRNGTWVCQCVTPQAGVDGAAQAASCVHNECAEAVNADVCTSGAQACVDPDNSTASTEDWQCACVPPQLGEPRVAAAAACVDPLDECTDTSVSDVCASAGQACRDPNPAATGTWVCGCIPPYNGTDRLMQAAYCTHDECTEPANADVCATSAQRCVDSDDTAAGDWRCECMPPQLGQPSTMAAAICVDPIDECATAANADVCAAAGQLCVDGDRAVSGSWVCRCPAPAVGADGAMEAATCTYDECGNVLNAAVCTMRAQACVDPNDSALSVGNWRCECVPPQLGQPRVTAAAACVDPVDECTTAANADVCADAGQLCVDDDQAANETWICRCVAPATGPDSTTRAAACAYDECTAPANADVCTASAQACVDPDNSTASAGDWRCECMPPQLGQPSTMAAATCIDPEDECASPANADVCAAAGQACVDEDQEASGTWVCRCVPPAAGANGAMQAATCTYNECGNATNAGVCTMNAQACVDPDNSTVSTGDWRCECIPPKQGEPGVAAAATCYEVVDECTVGTNAETCTSAGQMCADDDLETAGDWVCRCMTPATGADGMMQPALCVYDECVDAGNAETCSIVLQACVDDNQTTSMDWQCECVPPMYGTRGLTMPAVCMTPFDECSGAATADVCRFAGQACVDEDREVADSWVCRCGPPATGADGVRAAADCVLDECDVTANAAVCAAHGQACRDPNNRTADDWQCECAPPAFGSPGVTAPARCHLPYDECWNNSNAGVCTSVQQVCLDDEATVNGTWVCRCQPPSTGADAVMAAAVCIFDECTVFANAYLCTMNRQRCVDVDDAAMGDWQCECEPPAVGPPGVMAPAACTTQYNECSYAPRANICTSAGQTCTDTDLAVSDTWVCQCIPPATGDDGHAAPAACVYDECGIPANEQLCAQNAQRCVDVDNSTGATDDWRCECVPPMFGEPGVMAPTVCMMPYDECEDAANLDVCTFAAQACVDEDQAASGNWVCRCIPPAAGPDGAQQSAACALDECAIAANADTCASAGQICHDPDNTTKDDWRCECTPPDVGQPGTMSPATCMSPVDECGVPANAGVCAAANQTCVDGDLIAVGSWACRCVPPATGNDTIGAPATCRYNECTTFLHAYVCTAAWQTCRDPDFETSDDWMCECPPPQIGDPAVMAAADCHRPYDECSVAFRSGVCTSAGQACVDNDTARVDTWYCECVAPAIGEDALMQAATCVFDECGVPANADACAAAAQTCEDPNNSSASTGDWVCACIPPLFGEPGMQMAAMCRSTSDECGDPSVSDTCTSVGQQCVDEDKTTLDSWVCRCGAPSRGTDTARAPALCVYDECDATANAAMCTDARQDCVDNNTDATSAGDWMCVCRAPATGANVTAGPTTCALDECTIGYVAGVCAGDGQFCRDPVTTGAARDDWVCACVAPYTGSPVVAGPAACTYDECEETSRRDVCATGDHQACVDGDPTTSGDWVCACNPPWTGVNATQAPTACHMDECTVYTNRAACEAAGQECHDETTAGQGDWVCRCAPPATGPDAAAAPTTCTLNECTVALHRLLCESNGQDCVDDTAGANATDDWTCRCRAPYSGVPATMAPAACRYDECSDPAKSVVCTAVYQACIDADMSRNGTWRCECVAPATGTASILQPALCVLDECTVTTNAGTCTTYRQDCVDEDQGVAPDATENWVCRCRLPATGADAVASAASCTYDECMVSVHTLLCGSHQQACRDPDMRVDVVDDWMCVCLAPATGAPAVMAPATCVDDGIDECWDQNNTAVCAGAGQACRDPDAFAPGDWLCECVLPRTGGPGVAAPAVCALDECDLPPHAGVCTAAGQDCVDDFTAENEAGDWTCVCREPARGTPGVASAANCTLDECVHGPDASTCGAAAQDCVDVNPLERSRGDWVCRCRPPAVGDDQPRGPAQCTYDECTVRAHAALCQSHGQACRDEDTRPASVDDWQCVCVAPATGVAKVMKPADCFLDECLDAANRDVCENAGQRCVDIDTRDGEFNTWRCECTGNAVGAPVATAPAACVLDECTFGVAEGVCAAVGQECVDPTPAVNLTDDWLCRCTPPAHGDDAVAKPAVCTLDECSIPLHNLACTSHNQLCADGDFKTPGDWVCECTPPGVGAPARRQRALCVFDECGVLANAAVCEDAGQECVDPDVDIERTGDWGCVCKAPQTGAPQPLAPATCIRDECDATAQRVCLGFDRYCVDANTSVMSLDDWTCECTPPASLSAMGACVLDECANPIHAVQCTAIGQNCTDPDVALSATDDWYCTCSPPSTGEPGVMGPAVCAYDECTVPANADICAARGQACYDPDHSVDDVDDWVCECVAPASGMAMVTTPTTCLLDECIGSNYALCDTNGQDCVDDDQAAEMRDDWVCRCRGPATGNDTVAGVAICILDECTVGTIAPVCALVGQLCVDDDQQSPDTWACRCSPPSIGDDMPLGAAMCTHDECTSPNASEVCATAGQACRDPDPTPLSTGDWTCQCVPPETGVSAVAGRAACIRDECTDAVNIKFCAERGQLCLDRDTDPASLGDWECRCPTPTLKTPNGNGCVLDECSNATLGAVICATVGQICVDIDTAMDAVNNWVCRCTPPTTGDDGAMRPAACILDECAVAANAAVCAAAGQVCVDVDTSVDDLGDWVCRCVAPAVGADAVEQAATCVEDECVASYGIDRVCTTHGQQCVDTNTAVGSTEDWVCRCPAPYRGDDMRGGPAMCTLDECMVAANVRLCTAHGQECVDEDTSEDGSWACRCAAPSTGEDAVMQKAACTLDECSDPVNAAVCTNAGQACFDPDTSVDDTGDWVCRCVPPASGADAVGAAAACVHNECLIPANAEYCDAMATVCVDPDTDVGAAGDWRCDCILPAVRGPMGQCINDECNVPIHAQRCTLVGQECYDPNIVASNDWTCRCIGPAEGTPGVKGPANCTVDECTIVDNILLCAQYGQACYDPDTGVGDRGDWVCECLVPSVGTPGVAGPAVCELDECRLAEAGICEAAGQGCVDANTSTVSVGDWACACVPPAVNAMAAANVMRLAECELDECTVLGGVVCEASGQECVDPKKAVAERDDWVCRCIAPQTGGEGIRAPAACRLDECGAALNNLTCTAVGQVCVDPDTSVEDVGDWICRCPPPTTGVDARGTPALCRLDECNLPQNALACTALGQTCEDPTLDVDDTDDWTCVCSPPATGRAVAAAAACTLDECSIPVHNLTCTAHRQACVDPDRSPQAVGDWTCVCIPPAKGEPGVATQAACLLDDCSVPEQVRVCTDAGQVCYDPSLRPGDRNDWVCRCRPPEEGMPAVTQAAVCAVPTPPPVHCGVDELDTPDHAAVSCSGGVPDGTVCGVRHLDVTCGQSQCTAGDWLPKVVTCGCAYDALIADVVNAATQLPGRILGVGCVPGGVVAHSASCVFAREGFDCGTATCANGLWDLTGWTHAAAFPACAARTCAYDSLAIPNPPGGAVARPSSSTDGCRSGGAVASGVVCEHKVPGYACTSVACERGVFDRREVLCTPLPCAYNAVRAPRDAGVYGTGCARDGVIPSGGGCRFERAGHTCEEVTCTLGALDTAAPVCTPLHCNPAVLSAPGFATSSCVGGSPVASGTDCQFVSDVAGYACSHTRCVEGAWTVTDITCEARGCRGGDLPATVITPAGAREALVYTGAGCGANGTVASGGACEVRRLGYTCAPVRCDRGAWASGGTTLCAPESCAYDALNITLPGATGTGIGCAPGGSVAHAATCFFDTPCKSVSCVRGVWSNDGVVNCTAEGVHGAADAADGGGDDDAWIVVFIVLAVLCVVCLGLAAWVLTRRDENGRRRSLSSYASFRRMSFDNNAAGHQEGGDLFGEGSSTALLAIKAGAEGGGGECVDLDGGDRRKGSDGSGNATSSDGAGGDGPNAISRTHSVASSAALGRFERDEGGGIVADGGGAKNPRSGDDADVDDEADDDADPMESTVAGLAVEHHHGGSVAASDGGGSTKRSRLRGRGGGAAADASVHNTRGRRGSLRRVATGSGARPLYTPSPAQSPVMMEGNPLLGDAALAPGPYSHSPVPAPLGQRLANSMASNSFCSATPPVALASPVSPIGGDRYPATPVKPPPPRGSSFFQDAVPPPPASQVSAAESSTTIPSALKLPPGFTEQPSAPPAPSGMGYAGGGFGFGSPMSYVSPMHPGVYGQQVIPPNRPPPYATPSFSSGGGSGMVQPPHARAHGGPGSWMTTPSEAEAALTIPMRSPSQRQYDGAEGEVNLFEI